METLMITIRNFCEIAGLPYSFVYRAVRNHEIDFIRSGTKYYLQRSSAMAWLNRKE